ncbi:lysine-2,3-aminomutase-like protein [Bradyrhizobium sp. U87765 SZCCT0131]|uniref:lysine-2,3-aminomutase-like protein n=1 Tax=unclassified Bradyrhizobium TaxID=2631580 RepID=UPI001BA6DBB4|nr:MULTISPECIES: lysine-2,3-aminomutase-like protein [unclassified Bradyrhizobium]MBR1220321.1 lysine-2,3-aminomutase-like protein [Bradyrhizobium sp. U87765 SZCCT0131]MBR1263224.1 lysine-2,3-aminomutase-like protein [Bradyrhizobium sp. U87765 SZCCT0134]MBR1306893.1 lysine-2,3-aminomutase-like protein [Bradyrhizobium sp. U87765 SZCCT0110]MBR1323392.1 lysine-2,3-aminomutase-like protein [Bradyrhizobium sp. U87765 SZCCT0109]MBR1345847.1 lysine-2,3-aminomutase-like protein [Bradyrhizobium sp. U87
MRSADDLIAHGLAQAAARTELDAVAARYAVAVTPAIAALIDTADPHDPIARQYIPSPDELVTQPGEDPDPIGDHAHAPVPGIVHRYPDRVLLKLVHVCAVYCRFCFRREMVGPGKDTALSQDAYRGALDYIRSHPEVWEVILTGGDPLMLSPRRLQEVINDLAGIDHVRIVRLHTRVPVADPDRISDDLVRALRADGITVWVAVHANHPREFSAAARAACARLADAGIPLVSQSVLLRGVNDNPDTLAALMRTFVENRIKPYYLHHGDLAPGTAHLRTTIAEGQVLMRALRGHVSGLCQPEYVLDIPGGHGKAPVGPVYLSQDEDDRSRYRVVDYCGDVHSYVSD